MIHRSLIYRDKFGTPAMREVWTERAMVQRWLDVEAAIAATQGELDIIPKAAAERISRACTTEQVTIESIAAWNDQTGHVIVSLVKAFRDAEPEAGELFHFGPTTQDILDTGLTLQIRDALRLLIPSIIRLQETLSALAQRHKHTVMAGRSEGQIGSPITFGHKIAVLTTELSDHLMRLAQCTERLFWVTLFGATGVQSSFCQIAGAAKTGALIKRVGEILGLPVPVICPHRRTDRFSELGTVLAGILTTLGEAGLEVRDLQRSEVAEVSEAWSSTQHSSSTMPQKQNPETSEWLEGLARLGRGYALSLMEIHQQHERDISRLAPELHAIPNLTLLTSAAVESANGIFTGLQVHTERMTKNLNAHGGTIMAEALMLLLAQRSERKVWAHQLVHELALQTIANGGLLTDAAIADPSILKYLSPQEIAVACDPANYIGTAVTQVDAALSSCGERKSAADLVFARTVFAPPI